MECRWNMWLSGSHALQSRLHLAGHASETNLNINTTVPSPASNSTHHHHHKMFFRGLVRKTAAQAAFSPAAASSRALVRPSALTKTSIRRAGSSGPEPGGYLFGETPVRSPYQLYAIGHLRATKEVVWSLRGSSPSSKTSP